VKQGYTPSNGNNMNKRYGQGSNMGNNTNNQNGGLNSGNQQYNGNYSNRNGNSSRRYYNSNNPSKGWVNYDYDVAKARGTNKTTALAM